jgi:hypothetical protein
MAVLVVLLAVVVALLALLVAGLLRSHAEILRALHGLGVDMDPARADDATGLTTPVGAPTTRSSPMRSSAIRSSEVPKRPSRRAVDVVGTTPEHDAVSIAVAGAQHLTLLAFLSSGCGSCLAFWDVFRDGGPVEVPGDARLVCVSKDAGEESVASIRRLAPLDIPTVMSSKAWDDYDVPVAPFFVLLDGESGEVIGEGAANEWGQVQSLLHTALDDAGMLDRKGNVKGGRRGKPKADLQREARADRDLLAAGIRPGDPSLFTLSGLEPDDQGSEQ